MKKETDVGLCLIFPYSVDLNLVSLFDRSQLNLYQESKVFPKENKSLIWYKKASCQCLLKALLS